MTDTTQQSPDDFDLSAFEVAETATLDVLGLDQEPLLHRGQPVRITVHGPGSAAYVRAESRAAQASLARALAALRGSFDYVLIDTPPVLGVLMINALAASQRLLLPVQTDYLAIKGLERMAHTLSMVVRARGQDVAWTVVPTMFDAGSEAAASGLRALLRAFTDRVGDSVIPLDNVFREASLQGVLPSRLAPGSRGVRSYRRLLASLGALDAAEPRRWLGPAA